MDGLGCRFSSLFESNVADLNSIITHSLSTLSIIIRLVCLQIQLFQG